jgi:hypothetical protein
LILVAGEPEEPVLLGDCCHLAVVAAAPPLVKLGGYMKLLAPHAVQALVVAAVQVTRGGAGAPEPLHPRPVPGVPAGPDEIVEGEVQRPAQRLEARRVGVDERLCRHARGLCRQHVFQ